MFYIKTACPKVEKSAKTTYRFFPVSKKLLVNKNIFHNLPKTYSNFSNIM
jgi:hypothetical protein